MNDNALIKKVLDLVLQQETAAAIPGLPLAQAFQPTSQGVNTEPTGFIYKVGDRRIGSPEITDIWDPDNHRMVHTQLQQMETTFQVSALATQSPSTPDDYTASDICNLMAAILQSSVTVDTLEATQPYGIGILRITEVRNPYFKDDRDQNEANPSFDFVLTHKQVIITTTPVIESTQFQILRV